MTEAPPAPAVPAAAKKPNVLWAILAAFCPFAACPVTPVVTLASAGGGRSDPIRLLHEGGALAYGTLATFVLGSLVLMTLAVLLARGMKVPVTVMVFVAALPWLVGVAGMQVGMHQVMAVLGSVDPSMKATLLAQGIAEASACRLLGTFLSSGLCAATALALGLAAIANSDKPSSAGLLATLAAVPVLGACLLVPNFRELGPVAFVVVLPALAFLLAAGLGGLGVAGGARAAVVAATLGIPATLAVTSLARGVGVAGMIHLFQAIASVSPEDKGVIAAAGAAELASADKLALIAGILGALGAAGLAAFAFSRALNKRTVLIEVALCALIALLAVSADASAVGSAAKVMNDAAKDPWAALPGFQPLHADGSEGGDIWVLTPDRLIAPGGDVIEHPFSPEGLNKLRARVTELQTTSTRWDHASQVHSWAVALDQRVKPADFAALVDVARFAKMDQLSLIGRSTERTDTATASAWWIGLLGTTGGQAFWLVPPPEYGDPKPLKLVGPAELNGLSDSRVQAVLDPKEFSAQQLIDAAAKLQREGRGHPVLVGPGGLAALTGADDGPPPEHEPNGVLGGSIGGVLGGSPNDNDADDLLDSGSDRDKIAKAVRSHIREIQYCYEKRLRTNPLLSGKLTYQLTILATGAVQRARLIKSTLHDSETESCITSRLGAIRISNWTNKGVTTVNYPFVFTPGD